MARLFRTSRLRSSFSLRSLPSTAFAMDTHQLLLRSPPYPYTPACRVHQKLGSKVLFLECLTHQHAFLTMTASFPCSMAIQNFHQSIKETSLHIQIPQSDKDTDAPRRMIHTCASIEDTAQDMAQ